MGVGKEGSDLSICLDVPTKVWCTKDKCLKPIIFFFLPGTATTSGPPSFLNFLFCTLLGRSVIDNLCFLRRVGSQEVPVYLYLVFGLSVQNFPTANNPIRRVYYWVGGVETRVREVRKKRLSWARFGEGSYPKVGETPLWVD